MIAVAETVGRRLGVRAPASCSIDVQAIDRAHTPRLDST